MPRRVREDPPMDELEAGYGGRPQVDPYEGRRQVYDLTVAELRAHPAWWFPGADGHLTGPDQATALPVEVDARAGALEFPEGRYLLHAVFTLADGTRVDGHVTYDPQDGDTLAEREPALCTAGGQVPLWYGVLTPSERDMRVAFESLERTREQVFPLTWRTLLHPTSGPLTGSLSGFAILEHGVVKFL